MARKRKRLQLKSLIAVVLTVMLVIGAIGILSSPLMNGLDELDKMFSDSSSDTTDKPSTDVTPGDDTESENGSSPGDVNDETFSIEDFIGPPEFNGDIYESCNEEREEALIHLPII